MDISTFALRIEIKHVKETQSQFCSNLIDIIVLVGSDHWTLILKWVFSWNNDDPANIRRWTNNNPTVNIAICLKSCVCWGGSTINS